MSKTFLHCVQWKYVISTENITLMSLPVMFTLEIGNRNVHALSFAFALFLPHPTLFIKRVGVTWQKINMTSATACLSVTRSP